jgi:hypothetical protein
VRFLVFAVSLVLFACAPIQPKPLTGPNGRPGYVMRCSGMGRTMEACYEKAGTLCANGYTVIGQSSGTVIVPTPNGIVGAAQHTLAIECK